MRCPVGFPNLRVSRNTLSNELIFILTTIETGQTGNKTSVLHSTVGLISAVSASQT